MIFKIGDQVMLRTKNIRTLRPSRKLDRRQEGPFTIIDAWGKQAYKLSLPPQFKGIHPVFHVPLLEPFHARDGQPAPPPAPPGPIPIDGEDEWEIDSILAKRVRYGKAQYLVHWKGYSPADDSWEPEETVQDTEVLDRFEAQQEAKGVTNQMPIRPEESTHRNENKPTIKKTKKIFRRFDAVQPQATQSIQGQRKICGIWPILLPGFLIADEKEKGHTYAS